MSEAKDLANRSTKMVLLYSEACLCPGTIWKYSGGGYLHPPNKKLPLPTNKNMFFFFF